MIWDEHHLYYKGSFQQSWFVCVNMKIFIFTSVRWPFIPLWANKGLLYCKKKMREVQLYYEEVIFKGTTLKDFLTNVDTEMNSVRYLDKKSRHTDTLANTLSPAHTL